MPTSPGQLMAKALLLLDRGELGRGEAALRDAAAAAGEASDPVTAVTALCCLGELLVQQERPAEAADVLRSCLSVGLPDDLDDVGGAERARARRLLDGLA